jgi:single-stranded-DNA-specific exonuclease
MAVMSNHRKRWKILSGETIEAVVGTTAIKGIRKTIDILLKNRGIKTNKDKDEFFKPIPPGKITLKDLGLKNKDIERVISRIKKAIKKNEQIVIYGDYDTDGICATAVLWECLYSFTKNVFPYIPDRFSEGYGLNVESVSQLKAKYKKLGVIITVDNGISAHEAVNAANGLGIDVIVTDHHQKGSKPLRAHSVVHTDKLSGVGVAWVLGREVRKKLKAKDQKLEVREGLELAAIGTIADQVSLLGPNRSIVKYGLAALRRTQRLGLLELFREAGIQVKKAGAYEVGFIIAPKINAMGRLRHGLDSLRFLCTRDGQRARNLASLLGGVNRERQKIAGEVVSHARQQALERDWQGAIMLSHESYHEGVIGLAASKLAEEFYRPAVVFFQGKSCSKASARSISGFNIIKALQKVEHLTLGIGGHPMAAGLSIETSKLGLFQREFDKVVTPLLSEEILQRRVVIDMELPFELITWEMIKQLKEFEPTGIDNPEPSFATKGVDILDARAVGREGKHLKLKLGKNDKVFDAIAFGFGDCYPKLLSCEKVDVAYRIEENIWNGRRSLQLNIQDIKHI